MRICFVGSGSLHAFSEGYDSEKNGANLVLFGFNGMGEVSYEKELKGQTSYFEDIALLSKKGKAVVVCGCVTNAHGHKRKSAVVAENGKLSGVSDRMHCIDGDLGSGAALRVYETKAGRIGVAVAEDLYFFEVFKTLATCGSDFIVCPFEKTEGMERVLIRAAAYSYGVPVLFCAEGYCMLADVTGNIAFASPQSPAIVDYTPKKEYHLVETRRRGFYKPKRDKI